MLLSMAARPFELDELNFAFSNRIYFRFKTYRSRPSEILSTLSQHTLVELLKPYNIHLLESNCAPTEAKLRASLLPTEAAASAASKIKGRISKWVSNQSVCDGAMKHLGRGYFAVTTGKSDAENISSYLERQSEHHGYDQRVRPPVFVQSFPRSKESADILATGHAIVSLRYHVVLATQGRKGVFCRPTGESIAAHWRETLLHNKVVLDKVSFVADHVHIAAALHPTIAPAEFILSMMNTAQEFMMTRFESEMFRAKISRLWQPSAYVGSFGELSSPAISAYVKRWSETNSEE